MLNYRHISAFFDSAPQLGIELAHFHYRQLAPRQQSGPISLSPITLRQLALARMVELHFDSDTREVVAIVPHHKPIKR